MTTLLVAVVPLAEHRDSDVAPSTAEREQLSEACGMAAEGFGAMAQGSAALVAVVAAVEMHTD